MVDSKKSWKAWLYLSPAIVLLLIFTVSDAGMNVIDSTFQLSAKETCVIASSVITAPASMSRYLSLRLSTIPSLSFMRS